MGEQKLKDEKKLKVIIVGDSAVGKTSLVLKFVDEKFINKSYQATVGFDYRNKKVEFEDTPYRLQMWDTAGQERYQTIGLMGLCYRDANCILFVYDVTNRNSYHNIDMWFDQAMLYGSTDSVKVLIGNKCDLKDKREVTSVDGQNLANRLLIPFVETSTFDLASVTEAFMTMVSVAHKSGITRRKTQIVDESIKLGTGEELKKSERSCPCVS